jgi:hypothetical protein
MEKFKLGNTGLDSTIRTANDATIARFGHLNKIVDAINSAANKFDVTFTGLDFRNIGTTPLLLIESSRTVIITSTAVIMTEQTEAFDFSAGAGITTTNESNLQTYAENIFLTINGNGLLAVGGDASGSISQGNAYMISKSGEDATTGDGIVRILGTYYEIDL